MGESLLFYDIETTGLNRAFDQILEFAAIRTDSGLNEIERFNSRIQLRPDVVPSPAAILVNRIRPERFSSGFREYEAVRKIHSQLNRPGTTSIGYNSIGFDDEFLRFSFYRNLLPAYTHQYANHCRRMDLLPITIIYWLYRKEALHWPELDGKASLKLEDLGAANGLFSGQSHDAMSDVEAALRLAQRLIRDTRMWQYLDGSFRTDIDAQRAGELPIAFQSSCGPHPLGLLVAGEFGTRHLFQAPVISVGQSIPYPKQTLWLRLDLTDLAKTRVESVAETTWVVRKRFGEPGILLPPIDRYIGQLGDERRANMTENLAWLKSHPSLFEAIIRYHRHYRYPFIADVDADASLYQGGFFPRSDEARCRSFHAGSLPEKIDLIGRFSSREARILATRLLCRNYSNELPASRADEFAEFMRRICRGDAILDYAGHARRTPQLALAEIDEMKRTADLDPEQHRLLDDLERYITLHFKGNDTNRSE
jgi:exodeoxyribonuclease-1